MHYLAYVPALLLEMEQEITNTYNSFITILQNKLCVIWLWVSFDSLNRIILIPWQENKVFKSYKQKHFFLYPMTLEIYE